MRLLKIRNYFMILVIKDAMSNYSEATPRSVASQLIGLNDFWMICNSVLNRGKSTMPPLFNGQEVLTTSTDKVNLFARKFSCNSTLDDGSQQRNDFPSCTEQKLSSKNITAKMVSCAIYILMHPKPLAQTEFQPSSLRYVLQSFLLLFLSNTTECLSESSFPSC